MATVRMATGSLLDAVSNAGGAVGSVFSTIADGAEYLNRAVTHIKLKQEIDHKVELVDYTMVAAENSAREKLRRETDIRNLVGNDEAKQKIYNEHYQKILNMLTDEKSED